MANYTFPCHKTGELFLLDSIERQNKKLQWITLDRTLNPSDQNICFRLKGSQHTFYFKQSYTTDSNQLMANNLRWGTTQTTEEETIRVRFIINQNSPVGENALYPPSIRAILSKVKQGDNNLYLRHTTGTSSNYSKYYVLRTINPTTNNITNIYLNLGNTTLEFTRITGAHKNLPLYKIFMKANKEGDWLPLNPQIGTSILANEIPYTIHNKIVELHTQKITSGTTDNNPINTMAVQLFADSNKPNFINYT